MDYFTVVNLDREPFSNSPDPDFFYHSAQHVACLQKIELALRLKRGLNIVIGAVGSGKTTICRTLLKRLSGDACFEIHLVLDPSFASPLVFLETIASMMAVSLDGKADEQSLKEGIKNHLYKRGIGAGKTVVLVVDEGQKLPEFCLEILRELLNYETNDHKLLQIVLFAQKEFQDILERRDNLADRVNLIHFLGPMTYSDSRRMIQFRVDQAGKPDRQLKLFTTPALFEIYRVTQGYPRKIINLCHQCILALIVQNRCRVNRRLVRSCQRRSLSPQVNRRQPFLQGTFAFMVTVLCVGAGVLLLYRSGWLPPVSISIGNKTLLVTVAPNHVSDRNLGGTAVYTGSVSQNETQPQPDGGTTGSGDGLINDLEISALPEPLAADSAAIRDIPATEPDMLSDNVDDSAFRKKKEPFRNAVSMPALLGTLNVAPKDTLGQMLMVVYGDLRSRFLDAVLAANPHIRHADAINVGDVVHFPAMPLDDVQHHTPGWWLKIGDTDSMEAAYREALTRMDGYPARRIIAVWDRQAGLRYGLFVHGYFFNAQGAENARARLPEDLSAVVEIISGWPAGTVFFSDPFAGKGRWD
ncbi:MAG: hypothetical protein CR984_01530 [Proteobacteria bacterium]|nr:MAG: hypothetical protein CR984_01530 [Pseudomonadota bacterium]PIE67662.1 MAG: hypothetical protein CSA23_02490 [Deltaproteobacteria bacterium]